MSEAQNVGTAQDSGSTANLVYILYLIGLAVGITGIVGLVMAYMNRSIAPAWVQSHYTFQIRTFWIGLLGSVIGIALTFILIGFLVLLAVVVWYVIRCIKGMQYMGRSEAYPNPQILDLVEFPGWRLIISRRSAGLTPSTFSPCPCLWGPGKR